MDARPFLKCSTAIYPACLVGFFFCKEIGQIIRLFTKQLSLLLLQTVRTISISNLTLAGNQLAPTLLCSCKYFFAREKLLQLSPKTVYHLSFKVSNHLKSSFFNHINVQIKSNILDPSVILFVTSNSSLHLSAIWLWWWKATMQLHSSTKLLMNSDNYFHCLRP